MKWQLAILFILMISTVQAGFFVDAEGGTEANNGGLWAAVKAFFTTAEIPTCSEDWQLTAGSCLVNDTRLKVYVDNNGCGTTGSLPSDNGTFYSTCNYCSYNLVYGYSSECSFNNQSQTYQINGTVHDSNWASCCNVTTLGSDCYEQDTTNFNKTYDGPFACEREDQMYLLAIIVIPLVLGFFFLLGSMSLSQEHAAIKIFLFLLAIVTVFASMNIGSIVAGTINPSYVELQDNIAFVTMWSGRIFFVLISYFIMYLLYKLSKKSAKQKNERLEY